MTSSPIFTERQSFLRHWWGLLLLTAVLPVLIIGLTQHAQSRPGSSSTWLALLAVALTSALLVLLRLDTRLDQTGIHYRLSPLHLRWQHLPWAAVQSAHVRSYDPLSEYGGWGIRGSARNRAYNLAGTAGLQLVLQDGRRVLLGTQRPAELQAALAHLAVPGPMPG